MKAFDAAAATATRSSCRRANRSVFDVVARESRGSSAAAGGRARAGDGRGQAATVVEAVTVRARSDRRCGRRGAACKVAARRRWRALAAALRASGASATHVRDFGSCARRNARSSGQLFVTRIARRAQPRPGRLGLQGQRPRAAASGAADATGRLRAGDRVLWLYCVLDAGERAAASARCASSADEAPGPPGASLRVRVDGYDDERARTPVAGRDASTLGAGSASHRRQSAGTAPLLTLPAAGAYALSASAAGRDPVLSRSKSQGAAGCAAVSSSLRCSSLLRALALGGCGVGAGELRGRRARRSP